MKDTYRCGKAACVVALASCSVLAFAADTVTASPRSASRDDCTHAAPAKATNATNAANSGVQADCASINDSRHRRSGNNGADEASSISNPAARGSSSIQQNSASTGTGNVPGSTPANGGR